MALFSLHLNVSRPSAHPARIGTRERDPRRIRSPRNEWVQGFGVVGHVMVQGDDVNIGMMHEMSPWAV
ncbi:MAG: hypothetical protein ABIQ70_05315 [Dokdonella sp.]